MKARPVLQTSLLGARQLALDMAGLMQALGVSNASEFERRFGIPRSRIEQLLDDTWVEISREHLQLLMRLADEQNPRRPFLQAIPHPVWQTFGSPTSGFVGRDLNGFVIASDMMILSRFSDAGLRISIVHEPKQSVIELMKTTNCLFIGSPKTNDATEQALTTLWPVDPPIVFHWPGWPSGRKETKFSRRGPLKMTFLDHLGQRKEAAVRHVGQSAGALVVCRAPLGTSRPVTTVIVAGCSKSATERIASDLISGIVFVHPGQLVSGRPSAFILRPKARGLRWYNIGFETELRKMLSERRGSRNR